jgi:DNA-binding MarR family transcriptional regulator
METPQIDTSEPSYGIPPDLDKAVDAVLETLPPVWDRIRSNLRGAATSKFDISLEQFHTLRHIRKGCCHTGDLAEKRQISRPAISQAVAVLVARGLVTRLQESGDRRLVRLVLTPYANEVLDSNFRENRAWAKEKMASLPADELGSVLKAMEILKTTFARG